MKIFGGKKQKKDRILSEEKIMELFKNTFDNNDDLFIECLESTKTYHLGDDEAIEYIKAVVAAHNGLSVDQFGGDEKDPFGKNSGFANLFFNYCDNRSKGHGEQCQGKEQ